MIPSLQPETAGEEREVRRACLITAYDRLATALETVDLERDPELATELVDAIRATDRAYAADARALDGASRRKPESEEPVPPEI